jgi:condensin complex subunit 1
MQTLLDTLMARARDQTSWTRACVCRTWAFLAEHGKVPMGHWNAVADVAIGAQSRRPYFENCTSCPATGFVKSITAVVFSLKLALLNTRRAMRPTCRHVQPYDSPWFALCEGRMEDKSSNVRKAAMQLLMTLLQFNPFGPVLEEPRLAATLAAHAAKLQVRMKRSPHPSCTVLDSCFSVLSWELP